ncbi:MAG: hypothetical protein NC935_06560, partial [Candidatus Omnitrophica bacterium]|nr:hypothetical protein [Candidatus Omnitrophota bacterium]
GSNFTSFINYLFVFSILYIFNMFLFMIYLDIAFNIDTIKVLVSGARGGATLIKELFMQIFKS